MDKMGKLEKPKTKVKYDRWFLIVLAILLWTLVRQLFGLTDILPGNWANINLWLRVAANLIAIFGVLWVIRMYVRNTKRQTRRNERIAKEVEKRPELKGIINDIIGR